VVGALAFALMHSRAFAAWFVIENGPVETVQGLLLATVLLLITRRALRLAAVGASAVSEVVLFYGFIVLLAGELEAWSAVFGRTLTTRHVLAMPRTKFSVAMVALALIVALSAAVAIYTLRHLRELVRWGLAALGTGWGRVLVVGVLIFVGTELFERRLDWILPTVFPRTYLEEGLELLANTFFVLALRERERVEPVDPRPRGTR
jgi:hypothetical protein